MLNISLFYRLLTVVLNRHTDNNHRKHTCRVLPFTFRLTLLKLCYLLFLCFSHSAKRHTFVSDLSSVVPYTLLPSKNILSIISNEYTTTVFRSFHPFNSNVFYLFYHWSSPTLFPRTNK